MANEWDAFPKAESQPSSMGEWDAFPRAKEVYDDPIPSIPWGDLAAGAVRGAGSIGATILAPWDMAKDAMAGKGLSLESNRQRRADMDYGLQAMGADPTSNTYAIGKMGAEVAGTLGVGGAAANTLRTLAPGATRLARAIEAWGMTAPRAAGSSRVADAAYRVAGGAVPGAISAGMIDPEHVGGGAAIGAAVPFAAPVVGKFADSVIKKGQQLAGGAEGQAIEYLRKTFPDNWQEVASRLKDLKAYLPMERPTIAAAAPDFSGKLSAIEQGARRSPEMADDFLRRDSDNQLARLEAAQRQAEPLDVLTQSRSDVSAPLYAAAKAEQVPMDTTLRTIMQGPEVSRTLNAMTDSMRQGQVNAAVAGREVSPTIVGRRPAPETDYVNEWGVPTGPTPEKIQIDAVERWKRAIDAELNAFNKKAPSPLGLGDINAEQLKTARNQLTRWIDQSSPNMKAARMMFASRSPHVNQATFFGDVANALDQPLTAEGMGQLNTMVKDLPKSFTRSTGIARYQTPEEVLAAMSPLGRRTLEGIYRSGQREVAGARASTGTGSLPKMEGTLSKLEQAVPPWLSALVTGVRSVAKRLGADTDEAAMELINRASIDPQAFARLIESTPPTERSAVMNGVRKFATSNQGKSLVGSTSEAMQ
jgi:hypothetical protein